MAILQKHVKAVILAMNVVILNINILAFFLLQRFALKMKL